MADRIQHTKQEWIHLINDLEWNPDIIVELEEKGYIKESAMADKIQMTEEQAKQMYLDCGDMGSGWKLFVERMKEAGYIRKSLLQQKVEEAEEMWNKYKEEILKDDPCVADKMLIKQYEVIQLFKEKHPEDFI